MNQFKQRAVSLGAALVVCAAAGLAVAGPAAAAGGDWLYTVGGKGYATWTWSSNYANITNVTKVAYDTSCNDAGEYTYLTMVQANGASHTGSRVDDSCSGGATTTTGGSFSGNQNILGVRVTTCEDVWGSDDCSSQYYDNPNT